MSALITQAQIDQFENEGYFLLPNVINVADLDVLRKACQYYIDDMHAEMDKKGVDTLGLNHRNQRYFIKMRYQEHEGLKQFLFNEVMSEICRATLGDEAYLFLEQYVVKAAEVGMKFSWHQDSGYIDFPHKPYITCWCTLDDVDENNGTVYILPYSKAGTKDRIEHRIEAGSNDRVGYEGPEPGIPVILPAGSIAIFSSTTLHRSGANTSDHMRRILLAQYSSEPIINPQGEIHRWAEPVLQHGQMVTA